MKPEISAFMDGALDGRPVESVIKVLEEDVELRHSWQVYHMIGDALRRSPVVSADFTHRTMAALAAEPTVLAPAPVRRAKAPVRYVLPVAASVMGIAAVAWVAQSLNAPDPAQVAAIPAPATAAGVQPVVASVAPPSAPVAAAAPMQPSQVREYLFVHQGNSPRANIQGVGHYVGSVSDTVPGGTR